MKQTGRALSMPRGLLTGMLMAMGVTLGGSTLAAKLVDLELLEFEKIGYAVMGILLAASWTGSITACGRIRRRLVLVSLLSGLCYYGLLLLITALFFGGQYQGAGETGLLVLCGSFLAVLVKPTKKKPRKARRRKIRNR